MVASIAIQDGADRDAVFHGYAVLLDLKGKNRKKKKELSIRTENVL